MRIFVLGMTLGLLLLTGGKLAYAQQAIIHDAEYYIIEAQNGEKWAADDKKIDAGLEEIRKRNQNQPPNIIYILVDDVGFGEIGKPDLAVTRGYKTPRISTLAKEGMSLQRMYTEPSCTPTRVAMMTGRIPTRTGMVEAKATVSGEGLPADEVTIAEVLRDAGYNTSHIGKWHMGDIEQCFANKQGFMHAEFPIHQQAQLGLFNLDAENAGIIQSIEKSYQAQTFTLDHIFVPDPSHMVTGVELRDDKLYEVDLVAGERWTQEKYKEMNQRYQGHALEQLRSLAKDDKPFYLNYWPLYPMTFTIADVEEFTTLNGGPIAESIVTVDKWVGEIIDEVDRLGIAENTLIVVMGDNGPFFEYMRSTGQSDRIYRGGKGQHLEGGVRVDAYAKWEGVIEAGSSAMDIMHISDLYTTFARLANATQYIPKDRVIDGIDQSGVLFLGETNGRRDYIFNYEEHTLKSVVKNKYKMHMPPPGSNPILTAQMFDLYRDPRESRSENTILLSPWAGGQFNAMVKRHLDYKKQYPDKPGTHAKPYEGIENLRPESQKLVDMVYGNSTK
ncbi:MAG: sulfatase-like hydrolase/transferase [bacterium]|nr:sulfatase-like hydrolase/transferase [bacterium]